MCFAGIEENVRKLVKRRDKAEKAAADAHVQAIASRIRHGHVHVLAKDDSWVRSVDLLESQKAEGFEPITQPVEVRIARQLVDLASR